MSGLDSIAAVLITREAGDTLRACLKSLESFPEVVVYDNGSDDDTAGVAAEFSNVTVHQGPFIGFGPTRNAAAALAIRDWILWIDADETVSAELLGSLSNATLDETNAAYAVCRENYFMGRRVRFSGWGNDWLVRLYYRQTAAINDAMVHEKVDIGAGVDVRRLIGPLRHEAVTELGQFLRKVDRYSEIRKDNAKRVYHPAVIFLKSLWGFLRTYFFQLGFLDGWRGLVIAWSNANGVFFKYMKPWAARRAGRS